MTECLHGTRMDVTDADTPAGSRAWLCEDCSRTVVIPIDADPWQRFSLMSPVLARQSDDGQITHVQASNGDSWDMPTAIFQALYRHTPQDGRGSA